MNFKLISNLLLGGFQALLAVLLFLSGPLVHAGSGWQLLKAETKAGFRGLSVVNDKVVWASGTGGAFVRTTDGGKTWQVGTVPGAEKLDFRDVEAFDANRAFLLSIGNGASSRIYYTADGGKTWQLQFQNSEPEAFYDALAFWDSKNGLAMSDPVKGRFVILRTNDSGRNWRQVPVAGMPEAVSGEGGFAASGTCLVTRGKREAFFVTGGNAARIFYSADMGLTWRASETPLIAGTAGAGIFSLAFSAKGAGIMVGGDYQKPDMANQNAAFLSAGGNLWALAQVLPSGYRSGVAFGPKGMPALAVGPAGSDLSNDGGKIWKPFDKENFNAVAASKQMFWAAGPAGKDSSDRGAVT